MVERFHRQLKDALRSRNCGVAWAAHLPWVLMGLCAAPKEDSGISSAELVYGEPMRLPGQPVLTAAPIQEVEASPPRLPPALPTRLYSGAVSPPAVPPAAGRGEPCLCETGGEKIAPVAAIQRPLCGLPPQPQVL